MTISIESVRESYCKSYLIHSEPSEVPTPGDPTKEWDFLHSIASPSAPRICNLRRLADSCYCVHFV